MLGEYARRPAPPADGDQWRINFSRVEWDVTVTDGKYGKIPGHVEHNWVWSPQGVIDMHRPERWGFIQFSTALTGTTAFRADPSLAARDYLMQVYDAQHTFRREQGCWAESLADLRLPDLPPGAAHPHLALTPAGFEAAVEYQSEERRLLLHVCSDSRLWAAEADSKSVVQ